MTKDQVSAFESRFGIALPDDYRQFLLTHNDGIPEPCVFADTAGPNEVRAFLGLHSGQHYRFVDTLETYHNRIPNDLIPIAVDYFGNLLCVGVKGKHIGIIFFWHHELEGTSHALTKIADSFSEFADSLYEMEDPDETVIDKILSNNDIKKLEILVNIGLDLEKQAENGLTLIEIAAKKNKIDIIKYLISKGASINNCLGIARKNVKFFPEFRELVEYLESLSSKE